MRCRILNTTTVRVHLAREKDQTTRMREPRSRNWENFSMSSCATVGVKDAGRLSSDN